MDPDLCDLLRVVSALPCAYSRRAMIRGLQGLAGRRVYIARRDLLAPDEAALAVSLLDTMTRGEACEALMVRLQCQRSKAYRLIRDALDARRNPAAESAATAAVTA
jgi:hypothetical protein